jgi:hypothetical protein
MQLRNLRISRKPNKQQNQPRAAVQRPVSTVGADSDEFMMVLMVTPIASLTVPIAVVIMIPVTIIPVVIPMILDSRRGERGSDEGSKHG